MDALCRAVAMLQRGGYTCILCDRDRVLTSQKSGIAPLLERVEAEASLTHMAVADKIIGRAAALLLIHAGVSAAYGEVMSAPAKRLLESAGIAVRYGTLTDGIRNRTDTGSCPMELAVAGLKDPAQAPAALRKALDDLRKA